MFWQESDLQTEPSYFNLTRMYEPSDEGAPLTLVGINTDLISQFPNETNQATLLQSEEIIQRVQSNFDREIDLMVKPFDKTFALNTETDGAAITRFSFKPSRRFSYEFSCVEVDEKNCAKALDFYAQELQSIRLEATKTGFSNSMKLIDSLLTANIDLTQEDSSRLNLQKNAFEQAIALATGEMTQVSESKYFGGETVETVDFKTYIFGLLIGLIIGLIILIQFIVSDDKIRNARSLISATNYSQYLGEIGLPKNSNSMQLVAASIRGASQASKKNIYIVPVGAETIDLTIANQLAEILDVQVSISNGLSNLSANDLLPKNTSVFIFAVMKDSANVDELKQVWSVIEKSGNAILGSVLIN